MKSTHTLGPWHAVVNNEGTISIMPETMRRKGQPANDAASYGFEFGTGHAIAFVGGWINDTSNAQLIAAAPDMLAALEWAVDNAEWSNDSTTGTDLIRAAIAKARGAS